MYELDIATEIRTNPDLRLSERATRGVRSDPRNLHLHTRTNPDHTIFEGPHKDVGRVIRAALRKIHWDLVRHELPNRVPRLRVAAAGNVAARTGTPSSKTAARPAKRGPIFEAISCERTTAQEMLARAPLRLS